MSAHSGPDPSRTADGVGQRDQQGWFMATLSAGVAIGEVSPTMVPLSAGRVARAVIGEVFVVVPMVLSFESAWLTVRVRVGYSTVVGSKDTRERRKSTIFSRIY